MKSSGNYDDPDMEQAWLDAQNDNVIRYLFEESLDFTDSPKVIWSLAPYISVWYIEPHIWVISGDLPTDYIQDESIKNASDAVKYFATRWLEISVYLLKGKQHPEYPIGISQEPEQLNEMGSLLEKRANLFLKWIDDGIIGNE
jgi:hypothetical protein